MAQERIPEFPVEEVKPDSLWRFAYRRFWQSPIAIVGAVIVLFIILLAILAPLLATHDPAEIHLIRQLQPPSREHLLGTDDLGRDVFSRLLYGTRVSLIVGLVVVIFRALIGIAIGLFSGFYGGRVDTLLMRITDAFIAFPSILLALAIMAIWGTGLEKVIIALSVVGWPQFARLVRGEILSVKEREYVEAARSLGLSNFAIIMRHALPNILPIIIVFASLNISFPIIAEASLSFLGLGIQPPDVSWGSMLSGAHRYMRLAWWLATVPGLAITITVIGFNLFGDGLRDALDPRMK